MLEIVAAVAGIVIIIAIFWDAFETMVLSRRVLQTYRIARLYYRATWSTWSQLTQLVPDGTRREALLGLYGPLSLIILIALWAILLITGFGLLHYGLGSELESAAGEASLGTDLYFSGTTFVTLGLGDVNPQGDAARALTVLEAGTGFGFLALVIGYLPVLYQAFSRRELTISLLDSRAGSPPSAGEFLRRHNNADDGASELTRLLRKWETWCGELLESHVSFPILALFRSQHERQSWLATLTFILDLSSVVAACAAHSARGQAELTFAIARHAAVDLTQVLTVKPEPFPYERLHEDELVRLKASLVEPGAKKVSAFDPHLHTSLRKMYEPYVYALGKRLLMPLPPWLAGPEDTDDWRQTPWA